MKKLCYCLLGLIGLAVIYSAATFIYVKIQMRPLPQPLAPQSEIASLATRPQVHLVHAVNSVRRAQAKDQDFEGFEVDLNRVNGRLMLAHDEEHFDRAIPLSALFEAVANPEGKTYWIDLKTDLTPQDIDELKALAAQFNVSPRRMLFETDGGGNGGFVKRRGLPHFAQSDRRV